MLLGREHEQREIEIALARPRTLARTLDVIAFMLAPHQHGAVLPPGPAGRKD